MENIVSKASDLFRQKNFRAFFGLTFNYLRYIILKFWFRLTFKETEPNLKKVNKNWIVYTYLKSKYKKFVKNYKLPENLTQKNSDYVWWCWFQGEENAPEIVKACLESVRRNFPGKKIIIITEKNMRDFVSFPDFIEKKYKHGIISRTSFSDLVRLELLIKYGGIWIDSTILCTAEPSYIFNLPLFIFKTNEKNDPASAAQTWFISSQSNNPILILTRDLLYKYWQNHNYQIHYFIIYFFMKLAAEKFSDGWKAVPFFSDVPPHILQRELFTNFSEERMAQIKRMSDIHKLTYKFKDKYDTEKDGTFYKKIIEEYKTDINNKEKGYEKEESALLPKFSNKRCGRILVDTTFFAHSEAKNKKLTYSTSIFTADLLDGFAKLGLSENFILIVNFNQLDFFKERFPEYKICVAKLLPVGLFYKLTHKTATKFIKKFGAFRRIAEKSGADAIWFPYAMNETFVRTKLKTFATIHDIYRIHHGTKKEAELFKNFILDDSTKLFSVSEYTKSDIIKSTGCKKNITVIPNSVVFDVSKQKKISGLESKNYILDLNAYIEKKNPLTLLKAFNLIKDKTGLELVFCGGYKDEKVWGQMQSFIEGNNLKSRVRLLFRVSDEERNWLLANAAVFATPSLFEGFGRTPVEAAICKIPVVSTKETSLFEATQGLCSYVDNAKDENEFAKVLLSVIQNPPSETTLAEISEKLSALYNPENCARKYIEAFKLIK